jgi:hypothetical protein
VCVWGLSLLAVFVTPAKSPMDSQGTAGQLIARGFCVCVLFGSVLRVVLRHYGALRCSYGILRCRTVPYDVVLCRTVPYADVLCRAMLGPFAGPFAGPCVVRCSFGVGSVRDVRCALSWPCDSFSARLQNLEEPKNKLLARTRSERKFWIRVVNDCVSRAR